MIIERRRAGRRALLLAALLAILATLVAGGPATAQTTPRGALIAAAEKLEASGYTARLRWSGEYSVTGELRYASPAAYGISLDDQDGGGFEYIVLDSTLYVRNRPDGAADWSPWQRRDWRPNQVVGTNVIQYDPRLPVALLRTASNLISLGPGGSQGRLLQGFDARVNFTAAIAAAYGLPLGDVGEIDLSTWPLTVWLDAETGDLAEITLNVPPTASRTASTATFTFDIPAAAPQLRAPADAVDAPTAEPLLPVPDGPAQSLPITLQGEGQRIISPRFRLESGPFRVRIEPRVGELQAQLWRIEEGQLRLVVLTASIGAIDDILFPAELPPGEYWLALTLPEPLRWTATIEAVPAGAESPP